MRSSTPARSRAAVACCALIALCAVAPAACGGNSVTVLASPVEDEGGDGGGCAPDAGPGADAAIEDDASRPPLRGTWPAYAHDFQRTAHADGPGEMYAPAIAWSMQMGGTLGSEQSIVADVDGDGRPDAVTLSAGRVTVNRTDGSVVWQGGLAGARAVLGAWNLDGAGAPEVVVDTATGVQVLDGADGHLVSAFALPQPSGASFVPVGPQGGLLVVAMSRNTLSAYDFRAGTHVTAPLWSIVGDNQTTTQAADVDGDGVLDLVRPLDSGFEVDDPLTGATKYKLSGPELGEQAANFYLWQLADVDGVPGVEIVAVDTSYFYSPSAGIVTLGVRGGALSKLWIQRVETALPLDTDAYTVAGAVSDLDGDGAVEVVWSQWTASAGIWATHVVDGATGALLSDIPGAIVQALGDFDGDGKTEIAVRSSPSADRTPIRSDLRVYDFDGRTSGAIAKPWSRPYARVVSLPASRRSAPAAGIDFPAVGDFDPGPGVELLVADDPADDGADRRVVVVRGDDGSSRGLVAIEAGVSPTVLGWGDGMTGAQSKGDLLLFTDDGTARVYTQGLREAGSFTAGSYANWVNVYGLDESTAIVAAATSTGELRWLDGTHLDVKGEPRVVHRVANVTRTALEASAGGPHEPMVQLAGPSPTFVAFQEGEDALTLVAEDVAGVEIWRKKLAPGSRPTRPDAYGADVTGDGTADLIVPLVNVNSLESIAVFDGKTGDLRRSTPLRTIINPSTITGAGAIADVNADGIEDLVVPVSNVGIVAVDLRKDPMVPFWTIPNTGPYDSRNGTVGAAKLLDDRPFDLFKVGGGGGGGYYLRISPSGAIEAASNQWQTDDRARTTDRNSVALVRRAHAATFDLALAGSDALALSKVEVLAGDTFAEKWTVYVSEGAVTATPPVRGYALHNPIGMDVDGDGADEIVLGSDDGRLYALRSADGSLAFSVDLGAPVQHVVAADVDRDPALEIVVSVGDGRLIALDEPGRYVAHREASSGPGDTDGGCTPELPALPEVHQNGGCACALGGGGPADLPGEVRGLSGAVLVALGGAWRRRVRRRRPQQG